MFAALRSLNPNKALGPDDIPGRILKQTAQQIALSLASLFNKSLYSAVVPDEWKLANVAPVFKRGIKEHVQTHFSTLYRFKSTRKMRIKSHLGTSTRKHQ